MRTIVVAGWLAVTAWTGLARPAAAQSAGVLVIGPAESPVVAQLQDELVAAGWEVRAIALDAAPADESLDRMTRMRRATAVVVATDPSAAIRIRILDPAGGASDERSVTVPDGDVEDAVRLTAIQVVEALRASRPRAVEAAAGRVEPPVEPPEAAPEEPPPPEPKAHWWATAGPGFVWSTGGVDAVATFDVGLRWHCWEYLTVAAAFAAPLGTPTVTAAEGSADLQPWRAYADLRWLPLAGRGWFQPDFGVGLGAAFVLMSGTAEGPYVGAEDLVTTFVAHVVAGLEYRALDWLALRLDGWVGMTVPGVGVRFGDRRVAEWGWPLLGVTLAAAVGW
ncbi:MAG: hypothetical protein JXB32_14410 [Deltaproteobacteria bacterium]|nr:hypothetical protein [Deltaproteobacteria bacterium]